MCQEKEPVLVCCKGCGKEEDISDWAYPKPTAHDWWRVDAYGIPTGMYCDTCYRDNYPYRRGYYYDFMDAGEYLDEDY